MNRHPNKVEQMTRECDELAASYWRQEASGRELAYKLWKNQVQKTVDFISVYEKKPRKMA
jgi:hypothetical protein